MTNQPQHQTNLQSSIRNGLQYISPCTLTLDLPFILATDKKLTIGMPYLYMEGSHIEAVILLDVWDADNYVYVKVIDLITGEITTLSWTLDYSGTYWLWSLSSYEYLQKLTQGMGKKFSHTSPSYH